MLLARGDPTVFATRPISAGLMLVSALLLILAIMPTISKKRDVVFTE
jgi:putative tricarboxylic transport membrane protein